MATCQARGESGTSLGAFCDDCRSWILTCVMESYQSQLAHEIKAKCHGRIGAFPKEVANANDANKFAQNESTMYNTFD
ncbi:hypothetical protein CY34DRAFT_203328 [Suillus luteus UH-Slu-Lm8-n1]|uniref:Uncharacterized protein n=1 Tax=Suillus luteus UH-Slu-Lm8-n1 TaxID=930992 RepID=A0A0D0AHY7_9AGAM|nr:hypothetical protein CY34DRAFT_203328 [Suillus luteus UH-Slu-Lm8-n1]